MVNAYKRPKKVTIGGMYYSKEYFSRRRNYYYGYNKYKNYSYYYKLQNYKKMNNYEEQEEKEKEKNYKDLNNNLPKGVGRRKHKMQNEMGMAEVKGKKRGYSRKKKCIIKILKRPTDGMTNEERAQKLVGTNGRSGSNITKEKNQNKKEEEITENSIDKDSNDVERKDVKKEKKSKKQKLETSLTKIKKSKEVFKFTSTQELFNLLLKDVKDSAEEETVGKNKKNNKSSSGSDSHNKIISNGPSMEHNEIKNKKESAKKMEKKKSKSNCIKKTSIIKIEAKGEGKEQEDERKKNKKNILKIHADVMRKNEVDIFTQRSDHILKECVNSYSRGSCSSSNNKRSGSINSGGSSKNNISSNSSSSNNNNNNNNSFVDWKNNLSEISMVDKFYNARIKGSNNNSGYYYNSCEDNCILLKSKNNSSNNSSKYYNTKNVENGTISEKKLMKVMKNVDGNNKYCTNKKAVEVAGVGGVGALVGGKDSNYLKFSSSKYACSSTNANLLLSHSQKLELLKNNSLKNEELKKLKKEEEEGFFAIPLYMRSPKPEQIPIPVYLSEDVMNNAGSKEIEIFSNGRDDQVEGGNKNIINDNGINNNSFGNSASGNSVGIMKTIGESFSNNKTYKDKTTARNSSNNNNSNGNTPIVKASKNYTKNVNDFKNMHSLSISQWIDAKKNLEKKKKKTFLNRNYNNVMLFNMEPNKSKQNHDPLNIGSMKTNKLYNNNNVHSSYMTKTSNYNGCNLHKYVKNSKVEKYFYNKKYKVKTYFKENHRNKNFYPLKDVKIAAY
ncbi:conserved Plasmodium protein, unknown function [Plasmodium malariae]|uniref:Uncharacterized protein n=1 Tax=Plasmodium malariae TaxID=5858 RepID=A0A1C3KM59_PLAMA|nr:conserved Plasmodium protein, unknown function [Plasmodium malariae]